MFAVVSTKKSAALYNVFPISAPSSSHPNTPDSNKPNFQHSDITTNKFRVGWRRSRTDKIAEAQAEKRNKMDIKIAKEGER
nr:hypothetical protein [Tanacetum cinerariifolium]